MRLLICLFAFLLSLHLQSQSCLPESLTFTRQGQVDSFAILYPGCTDIDVDFTVTSSNIKNLQGLSHIKSISGRLTISSTDITKLTDLESLERISQIEITFNNKLESLDGIQVDSLDYLYLTTSPLTNLNALSALHYIRKLYIIDMSLQNLNVFSNLQDYTDVEIRDVSNLPNLTGWPQLPTSPNRRYIKIWNCFALTSLQGGGSGIGGLELRNNEMLTDVSALNDMVDLKYLGCDQHAGITSIEISNLALNSISIGGNINLTRVDGPEAITEMHTFTIGSNPKLTELNGFRNVHKIDNVYIGNTKLTNLDPLESVDSILNSFTITFCPQLGSISALTGLRYIGGTLFILSSGLNSLSGLDSLNYVGGDFNFDGTSQNILSLEGLESLKHIGAKFSIKHLKIQSLEGLNSLHDCGSLELYNLTKLQSLDGLESLDTIHGDLTINYTPVLTDADAIHRLKYIGGDFLLKRADRLSSLPVFDFLNNIDGDLIITDNDSLQSLAAFQNLYYLFGELSIYGNEVLPSLEGLDNIYWYSIYYFFLKDNPALKMCVTPGICQYLAQELKPRIISNNDWGCQSSEEIINLCGPLFTVESIEEEVLVYPNPTSSSIYFTSDHAINEITIFDGRGIPLMKMNVATDEIDLSQFPNGIYFIRMQIGDIFVMKKVVKC